MLLHVLQRLQPGIYQFFVNIRGKSPQCMQDASQEPEQLHRVCIVPA